MSGHWVLLLVTLLTIIPVRVRSTLISNLDLVFETFNPISMVRFFEFNDKGWNISTGCIQDMFLYLDALHKDVFWALKLYDASSYYAGGIYAGNDIRTGHPDLCNALTTNLEHHLSPANGPPFHADHSIVPFGVHNVNAKYRMLLGSGEQQASSLVIVQTICMPVTCVFADLKQVMSYVFLPNMRNNFYVRSVELIHLRIVSGHYRFWQDLSFSILMVITGTLLSLSLFAMIYEKVVGNKERQPDAEHSKKKLAPTNSTLVSNIRKSLEAEIMSSEAINVVPLCMSNKKRPKSSNSISICLDTLPDRKAYGTTDGVRCKISQKRSMDIVTQVLMAFSWRQNYRQMGDSQHQYSIDIEEICVVKVLCTMAIIFVHTCTFLYHVSNNKMIKFDHGGVLAAIMANGTYSIDTFFFLSGISLSYLFYSTMQSIDSEHMCSVFDQLLLFSSMILNKLLRLTFPYLAVLILLQLTMKHFHDHGVIEIPSEDHVTCAESMWKNILYIDTFSPVKSRCMIWSWYISLESQFCMVASIVLLLARNHPRYAAVICSSFFLSSIITTTIIRANDRPKFSLNYEEELAFVNGMYDQPLVRISPYLLGICLGYLLYMTKEKVRMNWIVVVSGWMACSVLLAGLVFRQFVVAEANRWVQASLSSLGHTIWSMVLFWVILASISQHRESLRFLLASNYWLPLSKLTNCVLIIHPLITRLIILNMSQSFRLSFSLIVTFYFGFTIIIYAAAFALYMIYEAPLAALLKILYYRNFK